MAWEIPGTQLTIDVSADLSASQFKFVKMNGATIVAVAAVTDGAIGVLQNKPDGSATQTKASTVMVDGVSRVLCSEPVAAGAEVFLAADGRVTDTATGTQQPVGIAMEAGAAADSVVPVLLKPLGSVTGVYV